MPCTKKMLCFLLFGGAKVRKKPETAKCFLVFNTFLTQLVSFYCQYLLTSTCFLL